MNAALPRSAALPPQSSVLSQLNAECVSAVHWEAIGQPRWPEQPARALSGALHWVAENHRCNAQLWARQEQSGRATHQEAVRALQQDIEDCNRQRNQAIDAIDAALLAALDGLEPRQGALPPGETVGTLIDRLSNNALKVYHLGLQLQRPDACEAQLGCCADTLARLRLQRAELMGELDLLLRGIAEGLLSPRFDPQFRAYRDPVLDPCVSCSRLAP